MPRRGRLPSQRAHGIVKKMTCLFEPAMAAEVGPGTARAPSPAEASHSPRRQVT